MKGAIDRLAAHMNKEEVEQIDELNYDTVKSLYSKRRAMRDEPSKKSKDVKVKNVSTSISRLAGHKGTQNQPFDKVDKGTHYELVPKKEEVSQKAVNKFHNKLDKLVHSTFGKRKNEDIMDPQAAIAKVPDTDPSITERKRQMSKSARMIKALYKKKGMVKEDLYDHEKSDKSVATYGKKPKFDKADKKDSEGETKPSAAATLTGGTTLTGAKRDDVEIDPMMRNRPGQPDVTKKDDKKKDDKKEDKKKDK